MAGMYKLTEYKDFSGGMNDTLTPLNLKDNELLYAINVDLSEQGGFSNRDGCTKVNATSLGKKMLRHYIWTIGDQKRYIAVLKDLAVETYYLVKLGEDGTILSTLHTSAQMIYVFLFRNMIYFTALGTLYAYGYFHFIPTAVSQPVAAGEVVFNKPKTTAGTGVEGRFYKAISTTTIINTTNLGDAAIWQDVTDIVGTLSNQLLEVKPKVGVTDSNLNVIKKCTMFAFHSKSLRVFASGNPDDPSAIYFSEPNDANYFKATSVLYPAHNNLGKVTCLVDVMSNMLVGYEDGWYQFTGISIETNAEWKMLPMPYGCISTRSVVLTPYSITFLSKDGIYTMSVNVVNTDSVIVVSDRMIINQTKDKMENMVKSIINPQDTHAILYDNFYLLHYKDLKGSKTVKLDLDKRSFQIMDGYEIYDYTVTSKNELLYACDNYLLKVGGDSDIDVTTGNVKAIHMEVATKPYDFGENVSRKYLTFLYLTFRQYKELNISEIGVKLNAGYYRRDFGQIDVAESLVYNRAWNKVWGYNDFIEKSAEVKLIANRFQLVFTKDVLNDKTTVYAAAFRYKTISPKGQLIHENSTTIIQ